MERRTHFFVSRKNPLTWLMALCMLGSAVVRIVLSGMKGTGDTLTLWLQIVLPIAAVLLYSAIILLNGKERFYKTAIPVGMIALYYGAWFASLGFSRMVVALYWFALATYAVCYGYITAGRTSHALLLPFIVVAPLCTVLYLNRGGLAVLDSLVLLELAPDILMTLGMLFAAFAMRVANDGQYHATWGDRSDGRRVRTLPAMAQVSPYIMVHRNESDNLFSDALEITQVERYIRQKRREGLTGFGLMHVLLAAYLRTLCKYPALNRFLSGQKVYSRGNDVQFCLTVKKDMTTTSPDTVIKVHLTPYDTAEDVYHKLNAEIEKVKNSPLDSSFDNTAGALNLIPGVVLKFVVWLLKLLDYFGMLPKFLLEVSPFHGSVFFTSMGSLGIPAIYHHLYDFGNLPAFGAFGAKRRAVEVQEDGSLVERKYVDVKFVLDERIVDGFYYAAFFKHFKRILRRPEALELPPEEVLQDID